MHKAVKNNIYISILALITLCLHTIAKPFCAAGRAFKKWFIPRRQRDTVACLAGILLAIISCRYILPEFRVQTVKVPVEVNSESEQVADTIDTDAANMARVLYGLTQYNLSDNAKIAVFETIESRAQCTYGEFGDTISEVCLKPDQWQGFNKDSSYLQSDYDLALAYLNDDSGARLTPEGCYWLTVSNNGVSVRNKFDGGQVWKVN